MENIIHMRNHSNNSIINFVCCGQSGDMTHELYVIKNLYKLYNIKANLYIADYTYGGIDCCGHFLFDLERTYNDWKETVHLQPYINSFGILPKNFTENYINLNSWRNYSNPENKSWSYIMTECFNFPIQEEYKWIDCNIKNSELKNKILIHQSNIRHNTNFNWTKIIQGNEDNVLFITNSDSEYNNFKSIHPSIERYKVSDIYDLLIALNSCKLFIGNQSMPFAMASALDIPRIGILYYNSASYYQNEINVSKNLSWFLDENNKYNSDNISILI